jgi:chromate transporter
MRDDIVSLVIIIVPLSVAAIGGAASIYAPLQYQTVDVHHWLTDRQFLELFALARVTPGPGSMLTALIGWKLGGLIGALAAALALFVPTSIVTFFVARAWNRYRGTPWRTAIDRGLRPIAAGLVLSASAVLLRLGGAGLLAWAVAGASAAALIWLPKIHPALLLVGGGVIFLIARAAGLAVI